MLPTQDFPFLFLGCSTPEGWTDERLSFFNTGEVDRVVSIAMGLLGMGDTGKKESKEHLFFCPVEHRAGLRPKDISVISPFREQVWQVRTALRLRGLGEVDVGDVESLQGNEK